MRFCVLLLYLLGNIFTVFSQQLKVVGEIEIGGLYANQDNLPFWMYTNTSNTVSPLTNAVLQGSIAVSYNLTNTSSIEAGSTLLLRDGFNDNFQRRDLYLKFENNWVKAILGSKKVEERLDGLSSTNQNFLWSNNSRPLPGLLIEAPIPLKLSNSIGLDWGIAHYQLNDNRFVKDTRVHYKHLGAIFSLNETNKITARIQHFAQWGGNSPEFGKLEDDFNAFVDVFFAKRSQENSLEGESRNALGNHLGTYFLEYEFSTGLGIFKLYHEHPFEDGSGTRLANFPDGIWGVYLKTKQSNIFSAVLYEYITTQNQSGTTGFSGKDNYFNNMIYKSGWTYDSTIIGLPFFVFDSSIVNNENERNPVVINSISAHHFAVKGFIGKFNYEAKASYVERLGTVFNPLDRSLKDVHSYSSISRNFKDIGTFILQVGLDFGNSSDTNIGGGITYKYSF
ncbi:capsule assembly Wzi family protein [Patiriisocius hiemis]|uniref:Capsule assembly Wzi family protein n=1 Tax=Patiriisocius hiemis TaxID=3075604 RepID=A0ABU2YFV6_9FLAO|nr:capsule assembly Wzi family protein [Constantimarinum sp. W242]MDT0556652.1 capsule assembly Wzi family protein [Constantimarinum sp. W242]